MSSRKNEINIKRDEYYIDESTNEHEAFIDAVYYSANLGISYEITMHRLG